MWPDNLTLRVLSVGTVYTSIRGWNMTGALASEQLFVRCCVERSKRDSVSWQQARCTRRSIYKNTSRLFSRHVLIAAALSLPRPHRPWHIFPTNPASTLIWPICRDSSSTNASKFCDLRLLRSGGWRRWSTRRKWRSGCHRSNGMWHKKRAQKGKSTNSNWLGQQKWCNSPSLLSLCLAKTRCSQ